MLVDIAGYLRGILPERGIKRLPLRTRTAVATLARRHFEPLILVAVREMPCDEHRDDGGCAGSEDCLDHHRTSVAAFLSGIRFPVIGGKPPRFHLAPQGGNCVEPAAAHPHRLDPRTMANNREAAAAKGFCAVGFRIGKANSAAGDDLVEGPFHVGGFTRCKMGEMIRKLALDRFAGGVVQGVFQNGARQAGRCLVKRDERTPGGDLNRHGDRRVGQVHPPERVTAGKTAALETRQPFVAAVAVSLGLQPLVVDLFRRQRAFEQAGDRLAPAHAQHRKTGITGRMPIWKRGRGRAVADREILQPPVAVQADASRTDPADRHGSLENFAVLEGKKRLLGFHELTGDG